jgi:hypothetical protein
MALPRRAHTSRHTPHREPCQRAHHPPEALAVWSSTPPVATTAPAFALPHARPAPSPLCVARGADGSRPDWRSTELASRWRAGAAGEISQWGHGRGAGRWQRVGPREKWLYISHTSSGL